MSTQEIQQLFLSVQKFCEQVMIATVTVMMWVGIVAVLIATILTAFLLVLYSIRAIYLAICVPPHLRQYFIPKDEDRRLTKAGIGLLKLASLGVAIIIGCALLIGMEPINEAAHVLRLL